MNSILAGAAALLPSMLLLALFHRSDRFREPPRLLWGTFGLGVLAIVPAILIEGLLSGISESIRHPAGRAAFDAFVVAALVEESLKLCVLLVLPFRKAAFDEPMDGIVYGVASALGFATLENVLYVVQGGIGVAVMRGLLSVPGHTAWGALLGFFAGGGRLRGRPFAGAMTGLAAAVALHGLYDFPVMYAFMSGKGAPPEAVQALMLLLLLAVSALGWVLVIRLVRRARRSQTGSPPPAPAPGAPVRRPVKPGLVIRAVLGGILAVAGGLVIIGLAAAFISGDVEDPGSTALGGVVIGLLPFAVGLAVFLRATRPARQ
jgi:RsiW-degrading membrane proteinase PrsW (M82 family)